MLAMASTIAGRLLLNLRGYVRRDIGSPHLTTETILSAASPEHQREREHGRDVIRLQGMDRENLGEMHFVDRFGNGTTMTGTTTTQEVSAVYNGWSTLSQQRVHLESSSSTGEKDDKFGME